MRVRAETLSPTAVSADVLAVPIYREDREFPADLEELDSASGASSATRSTGASSTSSSITRRWSMAGRCQSGRFCC